MQLINSSSKALEYINGNWYIINTNDGHFLKRKYCMTWLCKQNAVCLHKEHLSKIENSGIFKPLSGISPLLIGGIVALITTLTRNTSFHLVLNFPIAINISIIVISFLLIITLVKIICKRDEKKLAMLLGDDLIWNHSVKVVFFSRNEKLKYVSFMIFAQLFLIAIMGIGLLSFFYFYDLSSLVLTDIILFFSLMLLIRQPKNFSYRVNEKSHVKKYS